MNYDEKFEFAIQKLNDFENFLEVDDFRSFLLLLLNLNSGGPQALLSQLGLGGGKSHRINIPFDPTKNIYYTKLMSGLSIQNQLMIYSQSNEENAPKKLIHKAESKMLEKHLSKNELKNLIPKDLVVLTPTVIDYTEKVLKENNKSNGFASGIESLFRDLAEFIISQKLKYIFLIEGEGDDPDLGFAINLSIDPTQTSPDHLQLFDVYIDEEKKLREYNFIKMKNEDIEKNDLKMEFMREVEETSHAELYNSHFTIIIPVKSFNKP